MSLAIVFSRASLGIHAPLVTVEVDLARGSPYFNIVGLPETAVKESKHRVRSALMNTHFQFPYCRITVNLAPADLPKEGGRFDLPIALGILAASQQISQQALANYEFSGELALSGELRKVQGILPMVIHAMRAGRQFIVPYANANEAVLVEKASVFAANHLLEVCAHLQGERQLSLCERSSFPARPKMKLDLSDVKGQLYAKRALEIAAAGRHSLLFIGPPGTGKTMLASRLPSILPEINDEEALEVAAIASISSSGFTAQNWRQRPFRSPHHSSSAIALVGGGRPPRPGEISLAHHGILFLDELPEFGRAVLESLREPLESGQITISRAAFQTIFPAEFQLLAAMNPCPCGNAGGNQELCQCSPEQIKRYVAKISAPLLDRIDMHVEVPRIDSKALRSRAEERSDTVRARVIHAQHIQMQRQRKYNNALHSQELENIANLEAEGRDLLLQILDKFNLSARLYHRVIKVARTIADLENDHNIKGKHISEALTYRCLNRIPAK